MRIKIAGTVDAAALNIELAAALGGWEGWTGSHNAAVAVVDLLPGFEERADEVRAVIEAHIIAAPPRVFAAKVAAFERHVDERLARAAAVKGYDSILSASLRAGYAGPFHDEGVTYATFMDATWAKCYEILGAVQAGQRAEPTWEEIEAELPQLPFK